MKHLFFLLLFAACAQKPKKGDIIYTQESIPVDTLPLYEPHKVGDTVTVNDTLKIIIRPSIDPIDHAGWQSEYSDTIAYINDMIKAIRQFDIINKRIDSIIKAVNNLYYPPVRFGDYISNPTEVGNGIPFSVIDSLTKLNHPYILTGDTILETKSHHFDSWNCCYDQSKAELFDANRLTIENGVITIYGKGDTTEITSPDFNKVKNFFIKKRNGPNTYYLLYYENPKFNQPDSVIQIEK